MVYNSLKMQTYNYDQQKEEWTEKLYLIKDHKDKLARGIYSTRDYYYVGWEIARHGLLVVDFKGHIVDANPFFCEKIDFQRSELIGKSVNDFCVRSEDLHGSDSINILTLLQSVNQQSTNQCEMTTKENKLYRCRWVANRIPADLQYPFSHSIVHVYFLGETNYTKIINQVEKIEKKESNVLYKILDSVWTKFAIILVIILTALGGSLPEILKHIINLF